METIEIINERLLAHYGKMDDKHPYWKVVWAEDQLEHQLCTHTDTGMELINPEVREVKKYSWIKRKYILEFLGAVPLENKADIPASNVTYNCVWVFEDSRGNALPPKWEVIEIVIKTVHDNIGYKGVKYKDPYSDPKTAPEVKAAEIDRIQEELFGDETPIGDALAYKSGVGYTTGQIKES